MVKSRTYRSILDFFSLKCDVECVDSCSKCCNMLYELCLL